MCFGILFVAQLTNSGNTVPDTCHCTKRMRILSSGIFMQPRILLVFICMLKSIVYWYINSWNYPFSIQIYFSLLLAGKSYCFTFEVQNFYIVFCWSSYCEISYSLWTLWQLLLMLFNRINASKIWLSSLNKRLFDYYEKGTSYFSFPQLCYYTIPWELVAYSYYWCAEAELLNRCNNGWSELC